jgi:acyl dehydratase
LAIAYERLKNRRFTEVFHAYTERDAIIYALGVGLGHDPLDELHLRFVIEGKSRFALPTFALVMAYPGVWVMEPDTGIDWQKVVNGEQGIIWHRPIDIVGSVVGRIRIEEIIDRGDGKGALIYVVRDVHDEATGQLICSISQTLFCRGDGGFGGPAAPIKKLPDVPDMQPSFLHDFKTVSQAALIYRLSGDTNPLHFDPANAASAGFRRPIMHGTGSFGIAGYSLLRILCNGEAAKLREMNARFTSPAFPGETIQTEIWQLGGDDFAFRCRAVERDVIIIDNGIAKLRPEA